MSVPTPLSRAAADRPELTVLVVNWNAGEALLRCLGSVESAAGALACETVLVDNASTDGSPQRAAERYPRAWLVTNAENLGFGRGVAAGLPAARGEFVAVVNPDVELTAGSLATLVGFLRRRGEHAAQAGPAIVDADWRPQSRPERLPGVASAFEHFPLLGRLARRRRKAGSRRRRPTRCDWVRGPCMVLRRNALEACGGFPTETFMYGEEMLLALRLREAGHETWYVPRAEVRHDTGYSARQRWDDAERAVRVRSARLLVMRRLLSRRRFALWNRLCRLGLALQGLSPAVRRDRRADDLRRQLAHLHREAARSDR